MQNYLTVDVEDYFHVAAFDNIVNITTWNNYAPRVVENTKKVLDLFNRSQVKGTFFILGWVAEKFPALIKEIDTNGHEIGCHSYYHRLVYKLTPEEFKEDTARSKNILEQLIGKEVKGYRAPSYSITNRSLWAFDILEELGFQYDSSIFPIVHDRYGIPGAPRFQYKIPNHNITEYPISTSLIFGKKIPIAGGGYFRIFPYWFTNMALKKVNQKEQQPFIFYFHPWEIDPDQPRMKNAKLLSKFRHYRNLHKTLSRLQKLLGNFHFTPLQGLQNSS